MTKLEALTDQQALDAAREEGRRQGLEEALNKVNGCDRVSEVGPAIRALIDKPDKPGAPVAEAAILLADHIDSDMNAANRMIEAYTKVTMDTPVRHWLSQCLRAIAQKEVD